MRSSSRRILAGLIALVMASALIGCGGDDDGASGGGGGGGGGGAGPTSPDGGSADGEPIVIPVLVELQGASAANGQAAQAGAITAAHMINEAGGIDGRPIELKFYDGQSDPTAEGVAIRQIVGTEPPVITGAFLGSAFLPSLPILKQADIPMLWSAALVPGTEEMPNWSTTVDVSGAILGPLAHLEEEFGSLDGKRVAVAAFGPSPLIDERLEIGKAYVEEAGGTWGPVIRDGSPIASWSSQAANVVSAGADAVITINGEGPVTTIGKALGVAGFEGIIVSDSVAGSDAMLEAIGLDNMHAIRDTNNVVDGNELHAAAQAAGADLTKAKLANGFAKQFAAMYAIAATLEACGLPCSADDFGTTLAGLGEIPVPADALLGPMDFSQGQSGINFGQPWRWDADAGKSVEAGPVVNF